MKKTTLLSSIFFVFISISLGFSKNNEYNLDLKTPQSTIYNHLYYLSGENYNPKLSALSFDIKDEQVAIEIAKKLKYFLDGQGYYIDINIIPNKKDFIDTTSNKKKYVLLNEYPKLYLYKKEDKWLYSKSSIIEIENLFHSVFPLGSYKILELFPHQSPFVGGFDIWQIVALIILIFISYILFKLIRILLRNIVIFMLKKFGYGVFEKKHLKVAIIPTSILILLAFLSYSIPVFQLPALVTKYFFIVIKIGIVINITLIIKGVVSIVGIYLLRAAEKTENKFDDQIVPIVKDTLIILVYIGGALSLLHVLNVPILPLITGLSIGGLAFALAAQDTIKNFFGTIMIFLSKPFRVGDWITCGDVDGSVEEVGLRATRIRTFSNSVIYVSNAYLNNNNINNHGLRKIRRYKAILSIKYDTKPEKIEDFIKELKKIVLNHTSTVKDNFHVRFTSFGSSSLDILFYIFFDVANWSLELECKEQINIQILKLANSLNVEFAFPSSSIYFENEIKSQS